jgi:hypothetical protein
MLAASLLTCLALVGVAVGICMGESRRFSANLAAAGGGLLSGIALFWVLPEIAALSSWGRAALLTLAACLGLAILDRYLLRPGEQSRTELVTPLLVATGVHSFLDGWSVRAVPGAVFSSVAVSLGLALHKVPEGLALGWVVRKSLASNRKALGAAVCAELLTVLGAFLEPNADRTGVEKFGLWWMSFVLAVIAGSFLFLGLHAVTPMRRKASVLSVFALTLLLAGLGAFVNRVLVHS